MSELLEVATPHGPAHVALDGPRHAAALLVLGHGAGGGVEAPDLLAVRDLAVARDVAVARVLQPYRVAGRRGAPPAAHLDAAWAAVRGVLDERFPTAAPVHGGRSSGARVACRGATASEGRRPVGVLALAFPLRVPGKPADDPRADRGPELDAPAGAGVPVLAVTGERDRFGVPAPAPAREVSVVPGDHALRSRAALAGVVDAVAPWLARVTG